MHLCFQPKCKQWVKELTVRRQIALCCFYKCFGFYACSSVQTLYTSHATTLVESAIPALIPLISSAVEGTDTGSVHS